MISLNRLNINFQCFASFDSYQKRVICEQAARITRGEIENIISLNVNEYDALYIPGGEGVLQ